MEYFQYNYGYIPFLNDFKRKTKLNLQIQLIKKMKKL